ncbi:hypothetical+protein [Methylocapsa aurea]|uniref:hypothetical protein n=1 Tax=Methylocapsa aurea TaxID=663610 RepID=UPI003D18A646
MSEAVDSLPIESKIRLTKQDLFVGLGVLLLLVGFAPTFYLKPVFGAGKPLTLLVLAHGVTTTAWLAVFFFDMSARAEERWNATGPSA